MIKLAILALIIALVAGAVGLPGLSEFALAVSQILFSVIGLGIILVLVVGYLAYRWFKSEYKTYKGSA